MGMMPMALDDFMGYPTTASWTTITATTAGQAFALPNNAIVRIRIAKQETAGLAIALKDGSDFVNVIYAKNKGTADGDYLILSLILQKGTKIFKSGEGGASNSVLDYVTLLP